MKPQNDDPKPGVPLTEEEVVGLERTVDATRARILERARIPGDTARMYGQELRRQLYKFYARRGEAGRRAAKQMRAEDTQSELVRKWFKFIDADGSGEIDVDELEGPLTSMGLVLSREAVEDLLMSIDEDGSGEIGMEEFASVLGRVGGRAVVGTDELKRKKHARKVTRERLKRPVESKDIPEDCTALKLEAMKQAGGDVGENVLAQCFDTLLSGDVGDPEHLELGTLLSSYRRRQILLGLISTYHDVPDTKAASISKASLHAMENLERRQVRAEKAEEVISKRVKRRALKRALREFLDRPPPQHPSISDGNSKWEGDGVERQMHAHLPHTASGVMRGIAQDAGVEYENASRTRIASNGPKTRGQDPLLPRWRIARKQLGKVAESYLRMEASDRSVRLSSTTDTSSLNRGAMAHRPTAAILKTGKPGLASFPKLNATPPPRTRGESSLFEHHHHHHHQKTSTAPKPQNTTSTPPSFFAKTLTMRTTIGLPPQRAHVEELRNRISHLRDRKLLGKSFRKKEHSFWFDSKTNSPTALERPSQSVPLQPILHKDALKKVPSAFPALPKSKDQQDALDSVLESAEQVEEDDEYAEDDSDSDQTPRKHSREVTWGMVSHDSGENIANLAIAEARPLIAGRRRASLVDPNTILGQAIADAKRLEPLPPKPSLQPLQSPITKPLSFPSKPTIPKGRGPKLKFK